MIQTVRKAWAIPELKKKIVFTLLILLIFRIGNAITVPYIDVAQLESQLQGMGATILGLYNVMSGGAFATATVFALSIQPYINSSIIIQLLTVAIPYLENLAKDGGEEGRKKIQSITRYTTVAIAILQGTKGKGTAAFAAATTQGSTKSTVKEAFVYAMFSIGDPDMAIDDITAPSTVPSADAAYLTILSETAKEVTKLAAADAASTTTGAVNVLTGTTGKTAANGGVLGFRFFGDMTQAPVAADGSSDPWTDKDILSATVSFTFSPVAGSLPADPPTT